MTNSGTILPLSLPAWGCSPRPRKIPGISIALLPTLSRLPLYRAYYILDAIAALDSFSIFFSSPVLAFLNSLDLSTCSFMCLKSKSYRLSAPNVSGKRDKNDATKFFLTVSCSAKSVLSTCTHWLQTSSTSGLISIGSPLKRRGLPCGSYLGTKVTPLCSRPNHLTLTSYREGSLALLIIRWATSGSLNSMRGAGSAGAATTA